MTSVRVAWKLASVGNWLEAEIRRVGRRLHDRQVARIFRIPDDTISAEQTPCDFFGYTPTARTILIECKTTEEGRLPLGKNGLKGHQKRALDELNRANGISLLAWGRYANSAVPQIALLDPDMIRVFSEGRRSVPWRRIPPTHVFFVHELEQALELIISPGTL